MSVNENLHTLNDSDRLKAWVYRIASRQATDWFRRQSKLDSLILSLHAIGNKETLKGLMSLKLTKITMIPPKQSIRNGKLKKCMNALRAYVNRLPTQYREVIVLSEFEGFKNREIAEILGVSLDIVKIRIHRARTSLKQAFQSGCNLYYDASCEFACEPKYPHDG